MNERLNSQSGECAADEHIAPLAPYVAPRSLFDEAIRAIAGVSPRTARDGRRARMLAALDYQASWDQVRSWRRARRPAPQWAMALLARKAAERRALSDRIIAAAEQHKPGRGQGWRRAR